MGLSTALFDWHKQAGARIVDFGGWDMPVLYSSIVDEHNATRQGAGLFDVSHMGRLWFEGPQATALLDHLLTNHVETLDEGQVRYSLVLNHDAGIKDDVLVYRIEDKHLLVVNASNRMKLLAWFDSLRAGFDATIRDDTPLTSMIAVQGPKAISLVQNELTGSVDALGYYRAVWMALASEPATRLLVSRTGYTGEDGVELIGPHQAITQLWGRLLDAGRQDGVKPAGLGARDTLRLEAGMPLYGHELTEEIDPLRAGLSWAVASKDKDFVGKPALIGLPADRPVRVGLTLEGKRIAREGFAVWPAGSRADANEENIPIGNITSGTYSPTLEQAIAMAYVDPSCKSVGTRLAVDVRGSAVSATVVKLPFYKRSRAGGSS
ncbi:glycine cleavage system aminomethyltransferase GcvT [bacterium]|nr:glycine cleavage system aminomethyltransferase GcvT [bacterium]